MVRNPGLGVSNRSVVVADLCQAMLYSVQSQHAIQKVSQSCNTTLQKRSGEYICIEALLSGMPQHEVAWANKVHVEDITLEHKSIASSHAYKRLAKCSCTETVWAQKQRTQHL